MAARDCCAYTWQPCAPEQTTGIIAELTSIVTPMRSTAESGTAPEPRPHAYVAILLLALGVSAAGGILSALPLMTFSLEQTQSLSGFQVLLLLGAGGLSLTCVLLISGGIADRLGYRRTFLAGTAASIVGAGLTILSISFPVLIWALLIGGIGIGLQGVAAMAAIADLLPTAKVRAYAMFGAVVAVVSGGEALAAGVVASSSQARLTFALGVPLSAVSGVGVAWVVKNQLSTSVRRWDPLGMLLSVVGTAALFVGISLLTRDGISQISLIVVGGGIVVSAMFLLWERSRTDPMLNLQILGNKSFRAVTLTAALASFGAGGALVLATQYVQFVLDRDTKAIGLLIAATSVLDALAALASPVLLRWLGPRWLIGGALTLAAGTCVAAALFLKKAPEGLPVIAVAVVSVATTVIIAPFRSLIADTLTNKTMGAGFGLFATVRRFVSIVGMAVVVGTFAAAFGSLLHPALKAQGLDSQGELSISSVGQAMEARMRLVNELGPEQSRQLLDVQHDIFTQAQQRGLTVAATSLALAAVASLSLPRRRRDRDKLG